MLQFSDDEWFDLVTHPNKCQKLGFALPSYPPDDIQKSFTGLSGERNMKAAFEFYKYIRDNHIHTDNPLIMDFGAGWGRIARFFLRDTMAKNISAIDVYPTAVDWMNKTRLPCRIIKSRPLPPVEDIEGKFDIIYAFSVFSHLSQLYFDTWVSYLITLLKEDGVLIITIRGSKFIDYLERESISEGFCGDYEKMRDGYNNGEFQYYGNNRSDELNGEWFGNAFIPHRYIEERFSAYSPHFFDGIKGDLQDIVILTRNAKTAAVGISRSEGG